jgi:hypothetical protein
VVPVTPAQADLASQYQLIARLNAARMFNPGLRVLFVLVGGADGPSDAGQHHYSRRGGFRAGCAVPRNF